MCQTKNEETRQGGNCQQSVPAAAGTGTLGKKTTDEVVPGKRQYVVTLAPCCGKGTRSTAVL